MDVEYVEAVVIVADPIGFEHQGRPPAPWDGSTVGWHRIIKAHNGVAPVGLRQVSHVNVRGGHGGNTQRLAPHRGRSSGLARVGASQFASVRYLQGRFLSDSFPRCWRTLRRGDTRRAPLKTRRTDQRPPPTGGPTYICGSPARQRDRRARAASSPRESCAVSGPSDGMNARYPGTAQRNEDT